jgi:hypothetical protein
MIVAYGISRVIEKVRLITQGAEAVLAAEDNLNTILGRMNDAVEQLNGLATTAPETFFEFIGDVVDGSEEALGLATQEIDETLANFDKLTNGCSAAEEAVANQPFVGVLPAIEIVINILFAVQFIYEALPMFSSKIPA